MGQNYILVEAINIYANVLDTNQLSVIRGSSFLLKNAIEHIAEQFNQELEPLSTGASSGLFLVKQNYDVSEVSTRIVKELNKADKQFNLFPFIVEQCSTENLLLAKEQLYAQLRIRQMQSLTLMPDYVDEHILELNHPDTLEGRRIAIEHKTVTIQKKNRQLSHSVLQRWQHGKKLKQNYYFQEKRIKESKDFEKLASYSFSNNFEDLANCPAYTKLNGKIAVIYIDGNSFSKKQHTILLQAQKNNQDLIKKQQQFDQNIQHYRSEFLLLLLLAMVDKNPESGFNNALYNEKNEDILRIETLLWGGDEMLFVLPAWLGFEFLQYFFEQSKHWKIDNQTLTHAAGLVFCSAKTPIANIRNLAQSLAESVKAVDTANSPNNITGRNQNAWAYIVLESIDYPSNNSITDFNKNHYGQLFSNKPLLITAATNWPSVKEPLDKLLRQGVFPRRQLYRVIAAIHSPKTNAETATLTWTQLCGFSNEEQQLTAQEEQEIRLLEVSEHTDYLKDNLLGLANDLFGLDINKPQQRVSFWIYLYDLWDYLCPQISQQKEELS